MEKSPTTLSSLWSKVQRFFATQKNYKLAALVVMFAVILFFVWFLGFYQRHEFGKGYGQIDYAVFYVAGAAVLNDLGLTPADIYDTKTFNPTVKNIRPISGGTRFVYFPASVFVFVPLALFSYSVGNTVWIFANIAFVLVSFYLGIWFFDKRLYRLRYSILLMALAFSETVLGLVRRGQVNAFIWLFFMLGIYALWRNRQSALAGAAFGVNILLKIFPIVFWPYFVLKRRWRFLLSSFAFLIVIVGLSFPVFGAGWQERFWEVVLPKQLAGDDFGNNNKNNSLYGTFDFSTHDDRSPFYTANKAERREFHDNVTTPMHLAVTAVFGLWLAYVLWRNRKHETKLDYLLDYALIIVFVLLFAKGVRNVYNLWLIPPIVYLFSLSWSWRRLPVYVLAGFVLITTQMWQLLPVDVNATWYMFRTSNIGTFVLFLLLLVARDKWTKGLIVEHIQKPPHR